MPKEHSPFFVLSQLQELSKESDKLVEELPQTSALDAWFSSVREAILKLKECTSVKDIGCFPDIKSVICKEQSVVEDKSAEIAETQKVHIHAEKNATTGYKATEKNEKNSETSASENKDMLEATVSTSTKKEFEKTRKCSVLCKKIDQELLLPSTSTPGVIIQNSSESNYKSHQLMETPINRTFNKLINNTITLDSASSCSSNKKLKIGEDSDMRITRSGTKNKLPSEETNDRRMQTKSGSKRKSSVDKKESSKKQKTGICDVTVSIPATKAAKSKPHNKKNVLKSFVVPEVKSKVDAVIVPTMKKSTSLVFSKEKQLLVEIQKKEEKANENRKKVLAERQLKAAENKKKRDEKMEKTMQKRLQIEKEKEERLEKKETENKTKQNSTKEGIKKSALKTRTKELISEHMKENKSKVSSTSNQNEASGDAVLKTPNKVSSDETENDNYELTPMPDSSTYEFSDEEERPSHKPIPIWAQGVHLRSALLHQFYNPPNTDEIFGRYIESPDLAKIFYVQKKRYKVRTSSAVWNSPPNRSFLH